MYSSVRYNGRKLYELARDGIVVERTKRTIEVRSINRTSKLKYEDGCCKFKFKTSVSKGTYIRSLVNDFGLALNNGACLISLRRTKIGEFSVDNARNLDDLKRELMDSGTEHKEDKIKEP